MPKTIRELADEFMKKLTAAVKKITVGDTVKNPKIGKCSIYSCSWRNLLL